MDTRATKAEARRLRSEEGRSIKEIAKIVGIARSTASVWLRDLPLTPEQRVALEKQNRLAGRQLDGSRANKRIARERREGYQRQGRAQAALAEPLHIQGCMLYWGGQKSATLLTW